MGDFSRDSHESSRDYSLVRLQQGRLLSDADFNEQGDILREAQREADMAVIGPSGFPDTGDFALAFDADTGDWRIAPGYGYVAGRRVENRPGAGFDARRVPGGGGTWRTTAPEAMPAEGDMVAAEPGGTLHRIDGVEIDEDGGTVFFLAPQPEANTLRLVPVATYSAQPHAPLRDLPEGNGTYLAYLTVTDRPVTALDDPHIREVAFDGPDTATRDRTAWMLELIRETDLVARGAVAAPVSCASFADGLTLRPAPAGQLVARAEVSELESGPCTLPPAAGYRSLDNRLYRVQIHSAGGPAGTTWKWSRDNAIHRARLLEINAGRLVLDSVGRDEVSALKAGDWIEIRDAARRDLGRPGFFARIDALDGTRIAVAELLRDTDLTPMENAGAPDVGALPGTGFVTRWEGGRPAPLPGDLDDWQALEAGVEVRFGPGGYESGDFWTIPARSVTGDLDWPRNPATGAPLARDRDGPYPVHAPLALVRRGPDGAWTLEDDCRRIFPTLTSLLSVTMAGGDGQEVKPDPLSPGTLVALPAPLRVAVTRGGRPVAGARIRFRVAPAGGQGRFPGHPAPRIVETGADGIAETPFSADSATVAQTVIAERLDAAGVPTHAPLRFTVTLAQADRVSFDPAGLAALAGATDVQTAIEMLLGLNREGCTTYALTPDMDWRAVLEGLDAGENASICFARGTYVTDRPVVISKAGHLKIGGAGPGAVLIRAKGHEMALHFEHCASVGLRDIGIDAPDGNLAPDPEHRGGTATFTGCDEVTVQGCTLSCGTAPRTTRTCLTVRGNKGQDGGKKVMRAVTITGNRFRVGYLQQGVLVTDAWTARIADNRLEARPRPASLSIDGVLKSPAWTARIRKDFVRGPVPGTVQPKDDLRMIAAGSYRMSFKSWVPQAEFDLLAEKTPPTKADTQSEAAFAAYANGLIDQAVKSPDMLPSFKSGLSRLSPTVGTTSAIRRSLLVASEPQIGRFDTVAGRDRSVVLEAGGVEIAFDSPVSQKDWSLAMSRARNDVAKVKSSGELIALARTLSTRMVRDAAFAQGLSSVQAWRASFSANAPSFGALGIVCAGRYLGNVEITGNVIDRFEVGLRAAVSYRSGDKFDIKSVTIRGNRMVLTTAGPDLYSSYGLFVGNAETARIDDNDLILRPQSGYFQHGIRVWGRIGHFLMITRNRIGIARFGIRVRQEREGQHADVDVEDAHWFVTENLIRGPASVQAVLTDGTGGRVRTRDNTVAPM